VSPWRNSLVQETIRWVHTRSASIDFVNAPTLEQWQGTLTNAKRLVGSTLAEYTLMACSFLKDLCRLIRNKKEEVAQVFSLELRVPLWVSSGTEDIGARTEAGRSTA
jgi:hypothetical protein